ncbi:MAG: hypothetical protein ACKVP0_05340 [Pirellulaceae bacterium]
MNDKPYRPPVGWLTLGLAYGVILGHWFAYANLIPLGRADEYPERLAFTMLGCAFAGIVFSAALERWLQRMSIQYAWKIWCLVAAGYFLLYGIPVMNAVRE